MQFDQGETTTLGLRQAKEIAAMVHRTPGHRVTRIIFVKDGHVIYDTTLKASETVLSRLTISACRIR